MKRLAWPLGDNDSVVNAMGPSRPEHVVVAGAILDKLGPDAAKVKQLAVGGIVIGSPQSAALAVRDNFALDPLPAALQKVIDVSTSVVSHVQSFVTRAYGATIGRVSHALFGVGRELRLPTANASKRQIRDTFDVTAQLTDGREITVPVDIARRSESLTLQKTTLLSASGACIPFPFAGIPSLLVGAARTGWLSAMAYARGDRKEGQAGFVASARLTGAAVLDLIPFPGPAGAALGLILAGTLNAFRATRLGTDLADVDGASSRLRSLING